MIHSWTVDFRQSAVSKSSALSKAIRDGHYSALAEALQEETATVTSCTSNNDPMNLLLQANSRGWTPMHVAASSCFQIPFAWWKWMLRKCHNQSISKTQEAILWSAHPLWIAKTDMDQTCINLFFRAALYPLPWQRHEMRQRAKATRQAIEKVCASPQLLEELRDSIDEWCEKERECSKEEDLTQSVPSAEEQILAANEQNESPDSPTFTVLEFWKRLYLLLYMAHDGVYPFPRQENNCNPQNHSDFGPDATPIVHLLSSLAWCPEIVALLALSLYPLQCQQEYLHPNREGSLLPLHRWCQTRTRYPVEESAMNDKGILPLLCKAYPQAARIPDKSNHGRLALHSASARGKPWDDNMQLIFEAFPKIILQPDPYTGLPCVCLAAMQGYSTTPLEEDNVNDSDEIEQVAKQLDQQRLSLSWSYLSKRDKARALQKAQAVLDCQRLTTVYQVLRHDPSVLALPCM